MSDKKTAIFGQNRYILSFAHDCNENIYFSVVNLYEYLNKPSNAQINRYVQVDELNKESGVTFHFTLLVMQGAFCLKLMFSGMILPRVILCGTLPTHQHTDNILFKCSKSWSDIGVLDDVLLHILFRKTYIMFCCHNVK